MQNIKEQIYNRFLDDTKNIVRNIFYRTVYGDVIIYESS